MITAVVQRMRRAGSPRATLTGCRPASPPDATVCVIVDESPCAVADCLRGWTCRDVWTHRTAATTRSDEWGRRKIHRKEAVRRGKTPARPVTKRGGTRPDPRNRPKTIQSRRYRRGLPTRWALRPASPVRRQRTVPGPCDDAPAPADRRGDAGPREGRAQAQRDREGTSRGRTQAVSTQPAAERWCRGRRCGGCCCGAGLLGVVAADGQRTVRPGGCHGRPDHRARQLLHRPRLAAPAASSSTAATSTATTTAAPEPLAQGPRGAPRSRQRGPPSRRRRAPPLNAAALAANFPAAAAARGVREARPNTTTAGLVIDRGNAGARLRHARARCGRRGPRVLGRVGVLRVRDGRGARPGGRRRTACIRCACTPSSRSCSWSDTRTSVCRSGVGSRSPSRGGAPIRTSTGVSIFVTTPARRRSCWSTTPIPPPRCWSRPSCSGIGCRTCSRVSINGTRCTNSSSTGWKVVRDTLAQQ